MATVALTIYSPARDSITPAVWVQGNADGYTMNDESQNTKCLIWNNSGAQRTITVAVQSAADFDGITVPDKTFTIENGQILPWGYPTGKYKDGSNNVTFTVDTAANVNFMALR